MLNCHTPLELTGNHLFYLKFDRQLGDFTSKKVQNHRVLLLLGSSVWLAVDLFDLFAEENAYEIAVCEDRSATYCSQCVGGSCYHLSRRSLEKIVN